MVAQVDLGLGRVVPGARQVEMMDALRQRVALIPSVRIAAYGSALPPETEVLRMSFTVKDAETGAAVEHIMTAVPASPEYFAALQIRLARGRLFTSADTAASPGVGILNREAARRLFGEADPLGRILPHSEGDITIVGVVDNVKYTGIGTPTESVLYRPFSQQPIRFGAVLAKTAGDPALITNALREAIRSYDPGISVGGVQPLTTWVSDAAAEPRFRTMLSSSIAVLAMILAIVGLYALIAYSATQRTPEIGVRIAVGARGADIVKLLLFEGVRVALIGITIGLAGSLWLMRLLNAFLYGVTATDPVAFAGMAATVLTLALVASYIPARRAARIDPTRALRTE
jgi:putative ABC transport system permease protein